MTDKGTTPLVVGVAGAPRSGTTIVAEHLAANSGGVHVGELHLLFDRLVNADRLCGCGIPVASCDFWQGVWGRVLEAGVVTSAQEGLQLHGQAARFRSMFHVAADAKAAFGSLMTSVYAAVAAECENGLIIDSSKHPQYFAAMQGHVEVRLLHLVRDPRGVAHSWSIAKRDPDRATGAMETRRPEVIAAEWLAINALAIRVTKRALVGERVRLEDVVAGGVEAVSASLNLTPSTEPHQAFGHTVAGNPLRHSTELGELRSDDRWRDGMTEIDKARVSALTFPLLRTMGYSVGNRS